MGCDNNDCDTGIWERTSKAPVETRLTAEQSVKEFYDEWTRKKFSLQPLTMPTVYEWLEFAEAFRDKSEAGLRSKLQWLLANLCAKHADINTCSSGPCAMCEATGLREEIERLNKAFDLKQLIAEQYATQVAELRAKLAEQASVQKTLFDLKNEHMLRADKAEARCETFVEHVCSGSDFCKKCKKALSAAPERPTKENL